MKVRRFKLEILGVVFDIEERITKELVAFDLRPGKGKGNTLQSISYMGLVPSYLVTYAPIQSPSLNTFEIELMNLHNYKRLFSVPTMTNNTSLVAKMQEYLRRAENDEYLPVVKRIIMEEVKILMDCHHARQKLGWRWYEN